MNHLCCISCGQLRAALDEISDRTIGVQRCIGWAILMTSRGMDRHLKKRIEAAARPGETYEQVAARLERELDDGNCYAVAPSTKLQTLTVVRKPLKGDEQQDFYVPGCDVGIRDILCVMDVALFRLSPKETRVGDLIRYELSDGYVEVSAGAHGMATEKDYDLVIMAVSHLTEAMNRYKEGRGDKPGRVFRPHAGDVLKFLRSGDGGQQKKDLIGTCLRLNTTHVAVQRTKKGSGDPMFSVSKGESLISRYEVITGSTGGLEFLEIEIAQWMYQKVADGENPEVLTLHSDYFRIRGIGRFVYRLARKSAGKNNAKWLFQTIYKRIGSTGTFNKFSFRLRNLIKANDLPEYTLQMEVGRAGPLLSITYRGAMEAPPGS